ncbi:MAG: sulfatase [Candidatus Bathyarchaeota archaeon B63]|nr:MAG: sulfatase [Candidatus Bathyarchaeota archaeon B63]
MTKASADSENTDTIVILIALDTLRADHMSCYGYGLETTPGIDELAGEGVLFESCIAPAIPTHPGYTTIFTGLNPLRHGIVCHRGRLLLSEEAQMISQILYMRGFLTVAVDNLTATGAPWFSRGYEYYIFSGGVTVVSGGCKINGELTTRKAIEFLEIWREGRLGSRPLFMFIHYWDPHAPYLPPPPFKGTFYRPGGKPQPLRELMMRTVWGRNILDGWAGRIIEEHDDKAYMDSLYDEEILYADKQVSDLISWLMDHELYDESTILVTADHGELLGEHEIFYDHHGLYEGDIHIPLIIKSPGMPRGVRVKGFATHEDIAPTIIELLGMDVDVRFDGKPLVEAAERREIRREFVVSLENTRMTKRAIRTRDWKLIQTMRPDVYGNPAGHLELYDLRRDPEEKENIADSEEDLLKNLLFKLESWYRRTLNGNPDPLTTQPISMPIRRRG